MECVFKLRWRQTALYVRPFSPSLVDLLVPSRHIHVRRRYDLRDPEFHCQTPLMTNDSSVAAEATVLEDFELRVGDHEAVRPG